MPPTSRAPSGSICGFDQAGVAVADAEHLPALVEPHAHDRPDGGVHSRSVSSAGEDGDALHAGDGTMRTRGDCRRGGVSKPRAIAGRHLGRLDPASMPRPSNVERAPPKPAEKNYITPAGHRKLVRRSSTSCARKKRPEVVSALSDAAAEGDRSENAEYIYRKRQLREIDRRLRFLAKRLDVAVIVDPTRAEAPRPGLLRRHRHRRGRRRHDDRLPHRRRRRDRRRGGRHLLALAGRARAARQGPDDTVTVTWHAGLRELTIIDIDYH